MCPVRRPSLASKGERGLLLGAVHAWLCGVPGFVRGSNGWGGEEGGGATDPPTRIAAREELSPQEPGQPVLTRWPPRAFRPTGLLMVAKFPKSSATALCHFLPATANAFSHPPKAPPCDAFPRNLIVAIPNGGRAIQLSLRPHLFHHQLTPAHRAHQPVIVGSCRRPIRRPSRTLPRQPAAAGPDADADERHTHTLCPSGPVSPPHTPSQPPPSAAVAVAVAAPAPTPSVASCRIP